MADTTQPSPGKNTTEFLALVVTNLGGLIAAVATVIPPAMAVKYGIYSAGGYAILRTLLKSAHALGYAKQIPDIQEPAK